MNNPLKLASWNVNSLKVRLDQAIAWLQENDVDILALQETKLVDVNFPQKIIEDLGFYVAYAGQKTYNGVAIISRFPIEDIVTDIPDLIDPQRRILAATIDGIRLINLYVPNGSAVDSDKYRYKLDWLEKVTLFIREELKRHRHVSVVGDFNIAPDDLDVHDPQAWTGNVLVSPAERFALANLLELGLFDSFRQLNKLEKQYSWWDYRAASFRRNLGLRIDLILLNQNLMSKCLQSGIDNNPRSHERPSDHAPVWVSIQP